MFDKTKKIGLARRLRKTMTLPEILLWDRLKSRTGGLVFKRQVAIGPYVLDFFCYRAQLAVEVDGWHHSLREAQDQKRDAYFNDLGILTYRIQAGEVLSDADGAADGIVLLAEERMRNAGPPHHHALRARSPSPTSGEE